MYGPFIVAQRARGLLQDLTRVISPQRVDLARWSMPRHGKIHGEKALLHERNVFAVRRCQELMRQNRFERPVTRGPMHVNVFFKDGIIK
jgi:hypothetical protein